MIMSITTKRRKLKKRLLTYERLEEKCKVTKFVALDTNIGNLRIRKSYTVK